MIPPAARPGDAARLFLLGLGGVIVIALSGCGKPGPVRYRVHGTVTYDGRPVTYGRVTFDPDVTKDNSGPQGYAAIENGRFDTDLNGGQGTSGGPMMVTLHGFEPAGDGLDATMTRQLFSEHVEYRDLPKSDTEVTFEIQSSAKKRP